MEKIKVLLVDDSAVVRKMLTEIVSAQPDMEVCAAAQDPLFAIKYMEKQWPDVIVLDVEMPRMDGITFLKQIMQQQPTPVVMCSTLTEKGAETTMQAMSAGAVEIVTKPKMGVKGFLEESAKEIANAIRAASRAKLKRASGAKTVPVAEVRAKLSADAMLKAPVTSAMARTTERIIAIGTSTGGTTALEKLLTCLPRVAPAIVVVQHMPGAFTAAFAARLNTLCEVTVKEAVDGESVLAGYVYIAPGDKHMMIKRSGAIYKINIQDGPLVSRHKPSVDVLFRSVAQYAGKNAMGIIMTGMGDDGASGMLEMRNAGSYTLAENEKSCVVYGMPKEAVKKGAVDLELGLEEMPKKIMDYYHAGLK
ncbi:MAG: chemotaxis response regulator protein-glutamate methylesterase [Gammaproteobacteria bacterium]|nr:chemotaxis response regulator protein-glutamate methylesterase [Gammaproteobacteria bacterium]